MIFEVQAFSPTIIMQLRNQLLRFLNQARAGRRPARAWFLKIDPVRIVGVRVCVRVSAPEATNN